MIHIFNDKTPFESVVYMFDKYIQLENSFSE